MSPPRVVVVQFPGVNCEYESLRAIEAVGLRGEIRRWNDARGAVRNAAAVFVPGGWSYQDRIRAGVVAAKDPVAEAIAEAAARGVPVLGVCNGAQVLVEAGIVPGIEPGAVEVALARNRMPGRHGYQCRWAFVRRGPARCVFTEFVDGDAVLPVPYAHAEGRFTTSDDDVARRIASGEGVAMTYVTPDGERAAGWPDNPNGSMHAVAALVNPGGNAMAIMPHPERSTWLHQVPTDIGGPWGRARARMDDPLAPGPGRALFESLRRALS